MSKIKGAFSYKEWCIIKHGLKYEIDLKEDILSDFDGLNNISDEDFTEDDLYFGEHFNRDKFVKELNEEKRTLDRVTELIDKFKANIKN